MTDTETLVEHIWFDQEISGFYVRAEQPNPNCVKVTEEMRDAAINKCASVANRRIVIANTDGEYATLGLAPLFSEEEMLADFKDLCLSQLTSGISQLIQAVQKVNTHEASTFEMKYTAASAYLNGTATPAQIIMLETEADVANRDVKGLAQSICSKYESYVTKIAVVSGLRQLGESQIEKLVTWQEAEAWFTEFVNANQATIDKIMAS